MYYIYAYLYMHYILIYICICIHIYFPSPLHVSFSFILLLSPAQGPYQGSTKALLKGVFFFFQGGEGGRQAAEVLEACSVLGKARDDVVSKLNEACQMLKSGEVLLLRYSGYLLYWYKSTFFDTGGGA